MKIAYNPKTAAALTSAPANNDITFDLSGLSIYVRGERFKGTDTTYTVFKKHDSGDSGGYDGLVPVPNYNGNSLTRYLREDGTWLYATDVKLSEATDTDFRPIVLGLTHSATLTELVNPVTGQVYVTSKIYACPSTGILYATKLYSNGKEVLTEHQSLADYVTLNTPLTITGRKTFYSLVNITNGTTNDDGTLYTRPIIYMDSSLYMIYSDTKSHTIICGSAIRIQTSNGVDTVNILPDTVKTLAKIESDQTIKGTLLISTETTNSPLVVSSSAVVAKLNSDLLDGYHANGLFEELDNDGNNLSITIGGTKKNLIVNYATNSGKLGHSIKFKNITYQDVVFDGSKDIDLTGGIYYSLNSDYAKLLKINSTSTSTIATGVGTWAPVSGKEYVFRQKWTNSAASSDTADLAIYLDGNLTANMCLDGYYYSLSGFKKSGSDDNYALTGNGGHMAIHTGRNNEANKIVRTDGSGYIQAGWINTTSGDMGTTDINRIYCSNDGYIRYKTPANFFSTLANDGNQISITVGSQNRKLVVNYASLAGSTTKVIVNQHTTNNIEYPLIWSNLNNTSTITENLLFKSYSHLTYNPSAHRISTGLYIANNSAGPHFTANSIAGNWSYLRLNNGSTYWDIATRSNSGNGGLWLARLSGADNGIFVSTGNNVGISTSSPSYKLHIVGDSYTTGWCRSGAGFYCESTGVHFTHQGSVGEIDMTSNNEFLWGSSNANLFFNYRAVSRGTTVTNYIWNAGSSTSYASHTLGVLTSRGDLTLYGLTQTCNKANNSGYMNSALQIREYNFGGAQSDTWAIAPRLSWHWSGRVLTQIGLASNNELYLSKDLFSHAYKLVYETGTWGINISGTASNVIVNNSNSNSTYRMVWHSGNTLYGTNNIYCNPSTDQIYSAGFRHVSYNSASYLLRSDGGAAAFNWSGQSGQPTWLWGGNSQHTYYVYNPSNFNVNSAAVLRGNASNPNNSHPGHGAKVFYSWNTGLANNATSGYSNGITIGSHPSDTGYGFQIVQNMWDDRTYTRRYNGGWQSWKTLAWTSDIPTVTNYYWANVRVSASSSTGTSPTFQECYANGWFRSTGNNGWYNPTHGSHIHPNGTTTYGNLVVRGSKSGYTGINLGNSTSHMTVMSTDTHHGLYCENYGWEFYFNRSNGGVGIRTSSITKNFNVSGQSYLSSNVWIGTTSGGEMLNIGGWVNTVGSTGWYNSTYGGGLYMTDSTWIRAYNNKKIYVANTDSNAFYTSGGVTALGHMWSSSSAQSWLNGQRAETAALNIAASSDTGSYWPWFRQTLTAASKWISVGTLSNSLYFIGSTTSRTANSYDYGFRMDFSNGYLYGNFSGYLSGTASYATSAGTATTATTASKLSTNAGSSAKPVYFSGGIPVACGYSFKGLSTQPVVLVSGYFYRNYLNLNTWYFTGYKHSEIGSPSFSVNGGVMTLTFSNTVNVYFISACALSRLNFSGRGNISATLSASNTEYSWRSEGAYWFNTYVSNSSKTSYLYIRSFRMTDKNNDSWGSYASSWKLEEDAIHSVSFTIFGYI